MSQLAQKFTELSKVLFGFYRVSLLTLAIRNVYLKYFVELRIAKVKRIHSHGNTST